MAYDLMTYSDLWPLAYSEYGKRNSGIQVFRYLGVQVFRHSDKLFAFSLSTLDALIKEHVSAHLCLPHFVPCLPFLPSCSYAALPHPVHPRILIFAVRCQSQSITVSHHYTITKRQLPSVAASPPAMLQSFSIAALPGAGPCGSSVPPQATSQPELGRVGRVRRLGTLCRCRDVKAWRRREDSQPALLRKSQARHPCTET